MMKNLSYLFFATWMSITSSTVIAQWVQTNTGFTNTTVRALAISGSVIYAGDWGGGVYVSVNSGRSWTQMNNGLTNTYVQALIVSGSRVFAGTNGGGVFLSNDSGATWNSAGLQGINVVRLVLSGTDILASAYAGVYRSNNNGYSWSTILSGGTTNSLMVSGSTIWVGTNNGFLRSLDNGATWAPITNGLPGSIPAIFALAAIGGRLFAGTYQNGVYQSIDNGDHWTEANLGLTNLFCLSFAVSGTTLFLGTVNGHFYSTNLGSSWTPANTGLLKTQVACLAASATDLYAGTNGSIVWRRPLSEMVTSTERTLPGGPAQFSLEQNFPNPFNPSTTISFSLPARSFTSLKVYDMIGSEVATLVSEEMNAGTHRRQWNAANMPSGVYYYRLHAGTFDETKTVLLIR